VLLLYQHGKLGPADKTLCVSQKLEKTLRTHELQRLFPTLKAERFEQTGETEIVVAMQVSYEYLADVRQPRGPHELSLRAFAAINKNAFPATDDEDCAGSSVDCWHRAGGPQEDHMEVQGRES